jgi:two-component system, sensor histidine kinase PdtaS
MAAHPKLQQDDPSLSLALAMVCASPTPVLLLDGECRVVACSASFCAAFQIDPATAVGQSLFRLADGQWAVPQLRSLMAATISGDAAIDAYEAELRTGDGPPRCIVLNVRKLVYGEGAEVRLLVSVTDVTEARALEKAGRELAHDNKVLSQEIRHRVANSLQIIASVMMLDARRTSSEEVRGHLHNAHNRVMSVAQLQLQLAVGSNEAVDVHAYLTRLCDTIGASMIPDPQQLALTVVAPQVSVEPEVSVSLGLIVTELVINALKHAFPNGAGGKILVSYELTGPTWTLSVTDNGVGMPKGKPEAMAGLGSSIVEALARQLGADVAVTAMKPGTRVSIIQRPKRAVGSDAHEAEPEAAV